MKSDLPGRTLARAALIVLTLVASLTILAAPKFRAADNLPDQLSDSTFWQLINDLSEPTDGDKYPGGNNFTTNEETFQEIVPALLSRKPSGVYFGVAPEQNFTFIAALRPKIAFIIDLRRQNMIELLMYKALFEASSDRADFLSRLFARPRAAGIGPQATVQELFKAYDSAQPDQSIYNVNFEMMKNRLIKQHKFQLNDADIARLEFTYQAFFHSGTSISFSPSRAPLPSGKFPTYSELMTSTDGRGIARSYLASEDSFKVVKRLEEKNLIIPVVGDFTGPKSMRAVGQYVKEHAALVTDVYASTVEYILINRPDKLKAYYENLAALPIDSSSALIRCAAVSQPNRSLQEVMTLQSIPDLIKASRVGRINSMEDLVKLSKCGNPASAKYGCTP